jgi:hypothetical protein
MASKMAVRMYNSQYLNIGDSSINLVSNYRFLRPRNPITQLKLQFGYLFMIFIDVMEQDYSENYSKHGNLCPIGDGPDSDTSS